MVTEQSRGKRGKEDRGREEGRAREERRRYGDENVKIRRRRQKLFPVTSAVSVRLPATLPPRSSALSLFSIAAAAAAAAIVLLAKVVRRESDGEMSQKVGKEGDRPTAAGARPGGRAEKTERRRGEWGGRPLSDKSQSWRSICLPQEKNDFLRDRAF